MKQITSAGIIAYRTQPDTPREYLLLKYAAGHWDLPKGKVEKDETIKEAALRELQEEAGISTVLDNSFKESFGYNFVDHNNQQTHKTVIFFVGKITKEDTITLSHEHRDYAWLSYEKAIKKLTYENAKKVVKKAEQFLNK